VKNQDYLFILNSGEKFMPTYPPDFLYKFFWFMKIDGYLLATNPTYLSTLPILIPMEILVYVLAALTFYHAYKVHGLWKASLFLAGSFLYTGLEENMWILSGRLGTGIIFGLPLPIAPTYYFNYAKALFWFGAVPVITCLGWFFIAYGCFYIAEQFFEKWQTSNASLLKASLVAGVLAVNMDLMIDPFMVRNGSWYWLSTQFENIYFLGIPITNFIGWFLLIFLFAIFWTKITQLEERFGKTKTTLIFFAGIAGLLLGTIYFLILIGIFLGVLYPLGINISIPGWFGVI